MTPLLAVLQQVASSGENVALITGIGTIMVAVIGAFALITSSARATAKGATDAANNAQTSAAQADKSHSAREEALEGRLAVANLAIKGLEAEQQRMKRVSEVRERNHKALLIRLRTAERRLDLLGAAVRAIASPEIAAKIQAIAQAGGATHVT